MRRLLWILLFLFVFKPFGLMADEFDGPWTGALIAKFGDHNGICGFKKSSLKARVSNGRMQITGVDAADNERDFEDDLTSDGEFEAWGTWSISSTGGGVTSGRGKLSGLFTGPRSFAGEFFSSSDGGSTCVAEVFLKRTSGAAQSGAGDAPTQRGIELVDFARNGDLGAIKEALSGGTDVNARDGIGSTALMMAARRGDAGMVRYLIESGADAGLTNTLGQSAASLATKHGYGEVAVLLKSSAAATGTVPLPAAYDGRWRGYMSCDDFGHGLVVEVSINGSVVSSQSGIQGRVDDSGNISIFGTDDYTGIVETVGFSGWYLDNEFRLDGNRGDRACDMVLARLDPAPSKSGAGHRKVDGGTQTKAKIERQRELTEAARQQAELVRRELEEKLARQQAAAEEARRTEENARRKAEAERERLAQEVARLKEEADRARASAKAAARADEERQAKTRMEEEAAFWGGVKDSTSVKEIDRYLERYPRGQFAKLAKARVDRLQKLSSVRRVDFGTYHALVIGNDNYKHLPRLTTAVADAKAVAKLLRENYGFKVKLLTDANRHQIVEALDGFVDALEERDNLLIYYAGHGWLNEDAQRGYWQPVDSRPNRRSKWVSNATLTDTLKTILAKHVLVVADSCYSGTLTRTGGVEAKKRTTDYWQRMAVKKARVALTSGGLEPVVDKGGGENSPFAKAFIDALGENDLVMDATQLFTEMRHPVMVNAEQTPQYADVRNAGHDGGDFLFVRTR